MGTRVAVIVSLIVLGMSLSGCTHCGWLWDQGPRSCQSNAPK
jgi:hypothetical protein